MPASSQPQRLEPFTPSGPSTPDLYTGLFLGLKCFPRFPGESSSNSQEYFLTFQAAAAPSLHPQMAHETLVLTAPTVLATRSHSLFLDGPGSALLQAPTLPGCWSLTQGSKGVPQVFLVNEAIAVLVHDGEGLAETWALSPPTHPNPASLPRNNPSPQGLSSYKLLPGEPLGMSFWPPGYPAQ